MGASGRDSVLHETLCLECDRSCDKSCSWARDFVPVEGWEAEYKPVNIAGKRIEGETTRRFVDSYQVKSCPEFKPWRRLSRHPETLQDEGLMLMMQKCMELAGRDYIERGKRYRRQVTEFFHDIAPNRAPTIIAGLKKEAAAYERQQAIERIKKHEKADAKKLHAEWIHLFVLEAYRDFGVMG